MSEYPAHHECTYWTFLITSDNGERYRHSVMIPNGREDEMESQLHREYLKNAAHPWASYQLVDTFHWDLAKDRVVHRVVRDAPITYRTAVVVAA